MKKNRPKTFLNFFKLKKFKNKHPKPQTKIFISLVFFSFCFVFISTNCSSLKKKEDSYRTVSQIPVKDFFRNSTYENFKISSLKKKRSFYKTVSQPRPKDFFYPSHKTFRLSPNGKLLAYVKPYKNQMNVFVRSTYKSFQEETRLTSKTKIGVRWIGWKGNDKILFTLDRRGNDHIHIVHLKSKKGKITPLSTKNLTPYKGVRAYIVDLLNDVDPLNIFIKHSSNLYKFNLKTQKSTLYIKNYKTVLSYIIDHNGKVRLKTAIDRVYKVRFSSSNERVESATSYRVLYYRSNEKEKFTEIMRNAKFSPLFFTSDNKRIYALSRINRNRMALVEWDPKSKKEVKTLFSHPTEHVSRAFWSKAKKKLTHASVYFWRNRKNNYYFFDSEYKSYFKDIKDQLKVEEIQLTSYNQAESLFTVFASSDRYSESNYRKNIKDRGSYYLYDTKTKKLTLIVKVGSIPRLRPLFWLAYPPI